jgi:hypothetical protein
LHRRLGIAAALSVPLMLVLGYQTAIFGARRGHPLWKTPDQIVPAGVPFTDSLSFLIVPLGDLVLFAAFVSAALYWRRRAELHKRLMILGTIGGMLWPAITRVPHIAGNPPAMFGALLVLLLVNVAHDFWINGRPHPVNLWGGLLVLASFPVRQAIAVTDQWHAVAVWLTR